MLVTGKELQEFYAAWPMGEDDWYHEDGQLDVDDRGHLVCVDTSSYNLELSIGFVLWQGPGAIRMPVINGQMIEVDGDELDLVAAFKAWRGDTCVVYVTLKLDEVEPFKALCAANGWEARP